MMVHHAYRKKWFWQEDLIGSGRMVSWQKRWLPGKRLAQKRSTDIERKACQETA